MLVPPSSDDKHALEQQQAAADAARQAGSSSSRPLVFVRFLGTHDTAWLAPSKVSPWAVQLGERSSRTKAAAFVSALKEARAYAATGRHGSRVSTALAFVLTCRLRMLPMPCAGSGASATGTLCIYFVRMASGS